MLSRRTFLRLANSPLRMCTFASEKLFPPYISYCSLPLRPQSEQRSEFHSLACFPHDFGSRRGAPGLSGLPESLLCLFTRTPVKDFTGCTTDEGLLQVYSLLPVPFCARPCRILPRPLVSLGLGVTRCPLSSPIYYFPPPLVFLCEFLLRVGSGPSPEPPFYSIWISRSFPDQCLPLRVCNSPFLIEHLS